MLLECYKQAGEESIGNINHSEEEAKGGGLRHHAEREEVVGAWVK